MNYKILWREKRYTNKIPVEDRIKDIHVWPEAVWESSVNWLIIIDPILRLNLYYTAHVRLCHRKASHQTYVKLIDGIRMQTVRGAGVTAWGELQDSIADFRYSAAPRQYEQSPQLLLEAAQLFLVAKQEFEKTFLTYGQYLKELDEQAKRDKVRESRHQINAAAKDLPPTFPFPYRINSKGELA